MASGFFGAAEDALDVYLRAEPDDVCGFGQLFTCLLPGRQRCPSVGVGEGLFTGIPHWQSLSAAADGEGTTVICG